MVDAAIQLQPDGSGKLVDAQSLTNSFAQTIYRQTVTLGDGSTLAAIQSVKSGSVAPVASDGAAVVVTRPDTKGSTGLDASVNKPTLPNVAANFGSGGLYPNWVLLTTIAAAVRNKVGIVNMSSAQILVVRDDGTAANGAAPANASAFTLNPRVGAGPEGGTWESTTFFGRIQIYALSSSAAVCAFVD